MIEAIKALLSSKKFITAIVGLVVAGVAKLGLNLEPEIVASVLGFFAVLVGAQGAADLGKEAAKAVEAPKGDGEPKATA
jgi:hypothetical protein